MWEYRVENGQLWGERHVEAFVARLNELGRQGWEAVSMASATPKFEGVVLLKRQVR